LRLAVALGVLGRHERRRRPADYANGVAQLNEFQHGALTGPVALDLD
jgi:hypothetical protein